MEIPPFDPVRAERYFDACITEIGSFAEAARRLKMKTAWGVQKWRSEGVPHDRVIPFAAIASFVASPHDLRPDLYPHPDDGLPPNLRGLHAPASSADEGRAA